MPPVAQGVELTLDHGASRKIGQRRLVVGGEVQEALQVRRIPVPRNIALGKAEIAVAQDAQQRPPGPLEVPDHFTSGLLALYDLPFPAWADQRQLSLLETAQGPGDQLQGPVPAGREPGRRASLFDGHQCISFCGGAGRGW